MKRPIGFLAVQIAEAIDGHEWQPIETAPKDGTEVDLWCQNPSALTTGGGRLTDCHYHCGEWLKYGDDSEIGWVKIHNAIHWMLPPSPPRQP